MELISRARHEDLIRMCKDLPYNPTSGLRGIRYGVEDVADAVAAYDNWTENAVCLSTAGREQRPRGLTSDFCKKSFDIRSKSAIRGL